MQKSIFLLTFSFIIITSRAQYYYNDVVDLKTSNSIYFNLKKNNIQEITAASLESDNTPTAGFVYSKTLKNNGTLVTTHTELETGGASDKYDTYTNNLLAKSSENADNVLNEVEYSYDGEGKIILIKTQTDDTAMNVHNTELHKWFYKGNLPDSMIRIKDNTDSTIIRFKQDEHRNITEESWLKKGRMIEHYFYYYNDKNQLTDVVRYNAKAQKLLPDFLLEYGDDGMVSKLTQVPQGSSDYIVWNYVYDSRGLKTKDVLFDKHNELLGTVTYNYR